MARGSRKRRASSDAQSTGKKSRPARRRSPASMETTSISSATDSDCSDDAHCSASRTCDVENSRQSQASARPNATTAASDKPTELPYDVCFGSLLMEVICRKRHSDVPGVAPVQITRFGDILKLQYEGAGKPAGIVNSVALARLMRDHSVTLHAVLGAEDEKSSSSWGVTCDVRVRPLRVVVYGFMSEKDTVADILAESDLFLQYPEHSEYDSRVKYVNPMYLLPPGKEMPSTGRLMAAGLLPGKLDEEPLGEVDRSRVLRIFDEASGPAAKAAVAFKQSTRIKSKLKDHQLSALAMMVEKEQGPMSSKAQFPTLWETSVDKGKTVYRHVVTKALQNLPLPNLHGGILADEMGLGKTLSALALICHHLDSARHSIRFPQRQATRGTLIVTPKSTISGWQQQIQRHIRSDRLRTLIYHGSKRKEQELEKHDVVLTTYDTLRSDWATSGPLYKTTWVRIMLDEAHKIRNPSSKVFHAACEVPAHNRWCLTGTPMQNCLGDFGSLLAFIGVPPFVTHEQFKFWLASPLLSKQQNSLQTLRKLVQATCLRRTKAHPHLASTLKLPAKTERVESVDLSPDERRLYDFFRRKFHLLANSPGTSSDAPDAGTTKRGGRKRAARIEAVPAVHEPRRKNSRHIIIVISLLRRICDHGEALLSPGALDIWHQRGSSAVTWDMLQQDAYEGIGRSCCVCGQQMVGDNGEEGVEIEMAMVELMCEKHVACEGCVALADSEALKCPTCATITEPPSAGSAGSNVETSVYRPSAKVSALLRKILPTLGSDGVAPIKSVIFSQWTGMLDLVSRALAPHLSSLGLSCARLDGRSSLQQRRDILDRFNSDERCVIMLATIGAVGEGVDLTAATELHIVEPHWNPMAEAQAVNRVHRIGQTKDVHITRYCVNNSIEEYIQWVQNKKLKIIRDSLSAPGKKNGEQDDSEEDHVNERWQRLLEFLKG